MSNKPTVRVQQNPNGSYEVQYRVWFLFIPVWCDHKTFGYMAAAVAEADELYERRNRKSLTIYSK